MKNIYTKYFKQFRIKRKSLKLIDIPILIVEQEQKANALVSYILFLDNKDNVPIIEHTNNIRICAHITNILHMVFYESYFYEHMIDKKINISEYLVIINLENISIEEHGNYIKEFYLWYQATENIIRQRISLLDTRSPNIIYKAYLESL